MQIILKRKCKSQIPCDLGRLSTIRIYNCKIELKGNRYNGRREFPLNGK